MRADRKRTCRSPQEYLLGDKQKVCIEFALILLPYKKSACKSFR